MAVPGLHHSPAVAQTAGAAARVAIMQPYFIPYSGYFRLFAAADLFVIYDCVQFPRRGWVHRNLLPDAGGDSRWLTLPLKKSPRDVKIAELEFRSGTRAAMEGQMRCFPLCAEQRFVESPFCAAFREMESGAPVDFIVDVLGIACRALGLPFNVLRSSALAIDPGLRGQDRILAIAKAVGARTYVNAPGGRALYRREAFEASGVDLRFLPEWRGAGLSIMHRLLTEDAADVAADIRGQSGAEG